MTNMNAFTPGQGFLKKMVRLCLLGALALSLGGCQEKMVTVGVQGLDHHPHGTVTGFSINDTASFVMASRTCCVKIPLKWRPGLKAKIRWIYWRDQEPASRVETVEIPEYPPRDAVNFHVHFYPGHMVKIIVAQGSPRSVFYPMSREDLAPIKPYPAEISRILQSPETFADDTTDEDWKWAKQWGLIKPGVLDPDASAEILEWLRPWMPENLEKQAREYEAQLEREARDPEYAKEMQKAREAQLERDLQKALEAQNAQKNDRGNDHE